MAVCNIDYLSSLEGVTLAFPLICFDLLTRNDVNWLQSRRMYLSILDLNRFSIRKDILVIMIEVTKGHLKELSLGYYDVPSAEQYIMKVITASALSLQSFSIGIYFSGSLLQPALEACPNISYLALEGSVSQEAISNTVAVELQQPTKILELNIKTDQSNKLARQYNQTLSSLEKV